MQAGIRATLIDEGFTKFILDLGGFRETGSSFLGLLMTMTRRIRKHGAEAVLAHLRRTRNDLSMTCRWTITGTSSRQSKRRASFSAQPS